MDKIEVFSWTVPEIKKPMRLDVFCTSMLKDLSRSQLKNGMKKICVNGQKSKLAKKVNSGDTVEFYFKASIPKTIELFRFPLKIVYEDKNIIVVNKPHGMVTHLSPGHYRRTLLNALEAYRRETSAFSDEYSRQTLEITEESIRRGIVHRLDKDTSGLILTVRNEQAKSFYSGQFKKRKIKKYYVAILDKVLANDSGLIKTSISRSKRNRKKFLAHRDLNSGKLAISRYKVLRRFGNFSLVVFRIYTGRTHQIRVHAKFLGSGIIGDKLYNNGKGKKYANCPMMLHAIKICFTDESGKALQFKTKIPKRFKTFFEKQKANPKVSEKTKESIQ